jgi:hypothetical protein
MTSKQKADVAAMRLKHMEPTKQRFSPLVFIRNSTTSISPCIPSSDSL